MPAAVIVLGFAIFAQGTSELVLAGLLSEMDADLHVTVPEAALLIAGGGRADVAPSAAKVARMSAVEPAVEIIELSPDDWAVFRDVRLRALADAPEAFGSGLAAWADAPEERWRARLEAVPLNLVARRAGEHVGMTSGVVDGDDAELISMWVDPAVRGQGVARALIEAVVSWAEAAGRSTHLMVRSDNARAIAAYQKAGFVDLGVPDGHAGPPENRMVYQPADNRRREPALPGDHIPGA